MMQCKTAESADFDTLIARQCIADLIQNEFHGKLHILVHQMRLLGCEQLDKFRLGHKSRIDTRFGGLTIEKKKGTRKRGRRFFSEKQSRSENKLIRSEDHTSELMSIMSIQYAVFCVKKIN